MEIIIIIAAAATLLIFLVVWCLLARKPTGSRETQKEVATTTKRVVWFCLGNGICWVWCSYALAAMGRDQIAEALSQVAITEIIGVVLVYAVKAGVENLSKHNNWPDKEKKAPQDPDDPGQE